MELPAHISEIYRFVDKHGLVSTLTFLAAYCDYEAMEDGNLVIQEYHDQWMAARTEILRCAETIRKGGE